MSMVRRYESRSYVYRSRRAVRKRAALIACAAVVCLIIVHCVLRGVRVDVLLNTIPKTCPANAVYGLI